MTDQTKISDLTVAEFRQLMRECLERNREQEALKGSAITEDQGLAWMQARLNPASRMMQP